MSTPITGTYLDRIVTDVRRRLADASPGAARRPPVVDRDHRSLTARIRSQGAAGELAVIAEVKRRSPSVGVIDEGVDPALQAVRYGAAGAAGISVLTEPDHFGGSLEDLVAARASATAVPVLRKDFVVERSQLAEAAAYGADAVLLIAALHQGAALGRLVDEAEALGLEVLLEVHDEGELDRALATRAGLIGINNRDLRSFVVDLAVSERLAPLVPADRLVVAESGVRTPADAQRLREAGAHAILVGEALMRAPDAGALLAQLAMAGAPEAGVAT